MVINILFGYIIVSYIVMAILISDDKDSLSDWLEEDYQLYLVSPFSFGVFVWAMLVHVWRSRSKRDRRLLRSIILVPATWIAIYLIVKYTNS